MPVAISARPVPSRYDRNADFGFLGGAGDFARAHGDLLDWRGFSSKPRPRHTPRAGRGLMVCINRVNA